MYLALFTKILKHRNPNNQNVPNKLHFSPVFVIGKKRVVHEKLPFQLLQIYKLYIHFTERTGC